MDEIKDEKPIAPLPADTTTQDLPLAQRIENIYGMLMRVTTTPTWVPKTFYEGFAVDTTNNRFYWYDFTNLQWLFTPGGTTVAAILSLLLPDQSGNGTKSLTTNGTTASWEQIRKFGGDGSDGALATSSGTTTIDLGGAAIFVKNYTAVTIAGTANVVFTNPHAAGTIVVFRTQGSFNVTTSATRAIDLRGIGASAGTTPTSFLGTAVPYGLVGANGTYQFPTGVGGAGGAIWDLLNFYTTYLGANNLFTRILKVACGAAGAAGGNGYQGGSGQAGGRGGGVLVVECAGSWNVTGTNDFSGQVGTNGSDASAGDNKGGGGGGGGGSTGMFVGLYNSLVADSGTYTTAGGAGGTGGNNGASFSGSASGGGGGGGGASMEGAGATGSTASDTTAAPTTPSTPSAGAGGGGGAGGSGSIGWGSNSGGAGGAGGASSTKHKIIAQNIWFA